MQVTLVLLFLIGLQELPADGVLGFLVTFSSIRWSALGPETFGFCLRLEEATEGHVIRQVEPWSLAERSGLQDGDRVLEINGVFVDHLEHNKVSESCFLLAPPIGVCCYVTLIAQQSHDKKCKGYKRKGPHPVNFSLPVCVSAAHFLQEVDQESPAEHAGMCDGDLLLAVNGDPVEGVDHEDIVAKIRASGSQVTLTVIDCKGSDFYAQVSFSNGVISAAASQLQQSQSQSHPGPRLHGVYMPSSYLCASSLQVLCFSNHISKTRLR
uniref:PDZ domain containing 3a n=1 Tax=Erpetoichthys calabaricus TaxID=27687 RepID=A0A8C4TGI1_ERPCA